MFIKIINGLDMFEYFAGAGATVVQALLNRFPTVGDKVLLCDINAMHNMYLNERPKPSTDKHN